MIYPETIDSLVFPARAGMSRAPAPPISSRGGFPRTRGDEPVNAISGGTKETFPRTRGNEPGSLGDPLPRTGVGLVFTPAAVARKPPSEHTKYPQC